ncbi:MAG: RhuM family protein [Methanobacteriaceae archaeon]
MVNQDNLEGFKLQETIFYIGDEGAVTAEFIIGDETLWASQKTIGDVFSVTVKNISKHLNNIFASGELNRDDVIFNPNDSTNSGIVINPNAKTQPILYNLDAIIAVGYRVNSKQATHFRIWATNTLKEFMIKGFVLNDELLKNGKRFGKDYFDDLLEKIREIRTIKNLRFLWHEKSEIFQCF